MGDNVTMVLEDAHPHAHAPQAMQRVQAAETGPDDDCIEICGRAVVFFCGSRGWL